MRRKELGLCCPGKDDGRKQRPRTDYILKLANLPLANSTWPRTRETIDHCFNGVSAEDREIVLWKNAAELYRM